MSCREVTDAQLDLLRKTEGQYGVELRGAGDWAKARALVSLELADIEGDPGQEIPALMWATEDGRTALEDLEELEGFAVECPHCDGEGRIWNNADPTSGQWVDCDHRTRP